MMPAVASPAAASRSTTTTLAPLLAKASAVARPMPFPAPVISATLPVKSISIASSLTTGCHCEERSDEAILIRRPSSARDCFATLAMTAETLSLLPDQAGPGCEVGHHVPDEALCGLVEQVALGVEFGVRLADQHLGLVDRVHVEKDAAAPQIVLGAGAAGHAGGGAEDRDGLAGERLVGRARSPVDRVLQDARHRVVVFRAGEQERVGLLDLPPQRLNRRRKPLFP